VCWCVGPHARIEGRVGPAETQDGVRTSFSGSRSSVFDESRVSGRESRNRARKGHRILRRVLVGGRHLGSSRIIVFHEMVITATSAASRRWRRSRLNSRKRRAAETEGDCEGSSLDIQRNMGRGDRGVRGSIVSPAPWEEYAHARSHSCGSRRMVAVENGAPWQCVARVDPLKRSRVS